MNMSIISSSAIRILHQVTILSYLLISVGFAKELDADIEKRLFPLRDVRLSSEKRKEYTDEVFSLPEGENRLEKVMAKLAIASRYNGAMDNRTREIQPLLEKIHTGNYTPEELERGREFVQWQSAEAKIVNGVTKARLELQGILEALGEMADARAIPFLCPILAERGAEIDIYSDGPTATPQRIAIGALRVSTFRGLNLPVNPDNLLIEDWRKWWRENRNHYPPPPPALAALEATEGGTRPLTPAPPPPISPATPTPNGEAPASTPGSSTPSPAKAAAEQRGPRILPFWLIALPVILLLLALLARRRIT